MSNSTSKQSQHIGEITSWNKNQSGISGKLTTGLFKIELHSPAVARVCVTRESDFNDFSYATISKPIELDFTINELATEIIIQTELLIIKLKKHPFTITFCNRAGEILNEDEAGLGTRWLGEQVVSYKKLQDDERFIGLGEKNGPLDRKGRGYINWNTDNFAYSPDADPLYCSIPFFIGLHNNKAYGIFLDTSVRTEFNFGASTDRFSSFSANSGDLNYYFIGNSTVAEIIKSYTALTGTMPLPPKWSIGYQQCRYSYYPDKEVISIAENFRERDFPGDAIVLDIHYMDAYKIFTWDKKHFPNPKAMIEKLKELGFHVVIMCDPGIKIEDGYEPYESGKKENVFVKYPDGTNYSGQVWPGWCHFPDFTKPETRAWWANHFHDYVSLGVEGFWNDMNEIATWGNMLPDSIEFEMDGQKGTAREARNLYGMQMSRSTYEGTKALLKNKRPFNLTRAGFAGVQRYAAVWTGDNVAYDGHMLAGVRLVNSMGLSGLAFTGYDIGGFVGNADEKLFARWISIGAFSPFFRGHSMINSRDSEPWSYGEKVEEISRNYMKLRYRLMPYLYSLFFDASKTGMPINRSLAIDFTFDNLIYDHRYQNQYLFGPAIMVAPVESSKDLVKVYLPDDNWFELFTDKPFSGNTEYVADCPMEQIPLYVRGSSIIPMRERSGRTTSDDGETLEIHLYKGDRATSFLFYEDDGITFNYESGEFTKRLLEFNPNNHSFTIHKSEGIYESPFKNVNIFFHGFNSLSSASVNGNLKPIQEREYRFIEPITNYDPVNTMPEGPRIPSVKYISTHYDKNEIKISW